MVLNNMYNKKVVSLVRNFNFDI